MLYRVTVGLIFIDLRSTSVGPFIKKNLKDDINHCIIHTHIRLLQNLQHKEGKCGILHSIFVRRTNNI